MRININNVRGNLSSKNIDNRHLASAYLREWSGVSARLESQLAVAAEAQRRALESIRPVLEAQQRELSKALNIAVGQQARAVVAMARVPDLSGLVAGLHEMVRKSIAPAFEALKQALAVLPPRTRRAVLTLGAHGWYLDPEMPFTSLWELESALAAGDVKSAEQALCDYYESRLDSIEGTVLKIHPRRAPLFQAAFAAHRRGEYVLAIPVLLAQADGVCEEVTSKHLYGTRKGRPRTADYVDRVATDSLWAALLSPLASALPIRASKDERALDSQDLFRHAIMHGESCDYGTRVNGLKAIALVNYVVTILRGVER